MRVETITRLTFTLHLPIGRLMLHPMCYTERSIGISQVYLPSSFQNLCITLLGYVHPPEFIGRLLTREE